MIFKGTTSRTHFATVRQVCVYLNVAWQIASQALASELDCNATRFVQAENYGVSLSSLSTRESLVFFATVRARLKLLTVGIRSLAHTVQRSWGISSQAAQVLVKEHH